MRALRRPGRGTIIAAALLIGALAVRVGFVEHVSYKPINDAGSYIRLGSEIAHSGDYTSPTGAGGTKGPTAYFPPLYPYFVAAVDILDGHQAGGGHRFSRSVWRRPGSGPWPSV